eukprot:COSAG01_NODE_10518_length_2145_cov_1.846530_4_plen_115_part_01
MQIERSMAAAVKPVDSDSQFRLSNPADEIGDRIARPNYNKGREPIYLIELSRANTYVYLLPEPICLAGSAMRANIPHMTVPNFQFTSFGSVAEPIYLLPEVPSQFTSSARRLSVV